MNTARSFVSSPKKEKCGHATSVEYLFVGGRSLLHYFSMVWFFESCVVEDQVLLAAPFDFIGSVRTHKNLQ